MDYNSCVMRALSTMRRALGYERGVPLCLLGALPKEPSDIWILETAKLWFPLHEVKVWCRTEARDQASDVSAYAGEEIDEGFNFAPWVAAFGYTISEREEDARTQHFVVGIPDFRIHLTIIVAVKLVYLSQWML